MIKITEDAAARNRARRDALWLWPQPFSGSGFAWVRPPVLNPFTRIAVEMCAADGTLRAVGYEIEEAGALPRMVTPFPRNWMAPAALAS